MIIDHWGKVLARMPGGTGCVVADIDAAARMDARTRFPVARASGDLQHVSGWHWQRDDVGAGDSPGARIARPRAQLSRAGRRHGSARAVGNDATVQIPLTPGDHVVRVQGRAGAARAKCQFTIRHGEIVRLECQAKVSPWLAPLYLDALARQIHFT